jgi:tetratricopeptide (TPR) repeat protein
MATATEAIAEGKKARKEGDYPVARERYAAAAASYRERDDLLAYARTIRHIADIFVEELNLLAAKPLYEEALELYRSNLDTKLLDLANTVRPYALLQEQLGNTTAARKLWQEAGQLYSSLQIDAGVAECENHLAHLL